MFQHHGGGGNLFFSWSGECHCGVWFSGVILLIYSCCKLARKFIAFRKSGNNAKYTRVIIESSNSFFPGLFKYFQVRLPVSYNLGNLFHLRTNFREKYVHKILIGKTYCQIKTRARLIFILINVFFVKNDQIKIFSTYFIFKFIINKIACGSN